MRRSSMNTRSPETPRSSGAATDAARAVSGSGSIPRSSASRTRRRTRRGSSANARGEAIRRRRAARSASPPSGSIVLAARDGFGDRIDGEVAQRQVGRQRAAAQRLHVDLPGAVARDHAPAGEVRGQLEAGGSARGAGDRAGRRLGGAASTTMSRSNVSRPSARSRGTPPTSHAAVSASAARTARRASPGAVSLTAPARRSERYERRTRADRPQVIS